MELWLRQRQAKGLEWDDRVQVSSQAEWHELTYNRDLISSVLWPTPPLFAIDSRHVVRHHPHEVDYENDPERNRSFCDGCEKLAQTMEAELAGAKCLVYAPLRGALSIWRGICQFLPHLDYQVHFPVTSSFVRYPIEFGILSRKGKPASGRHNNILELQRLRPLLADFDVLVYVEEIVSGGMMTGHLKEMLELKVNEELPIAAFGLADQYGARSESKRRRLDARVQKGELQGLFWEGCSELITEDQKFLLGIHYVDYRLGPHVVPLLTDDLEYYQEKKDFDQDVYDSPIEQLWSR